MTDDKSPLDPAEQAEAARSRRRWLTLAEILGVAAVLISGLTLWNNYQQRTAEEADKAAARQRGIGGWRRPCCCAASPTANGGRLALAPADPDQTIQDQRILFPLGARRRRGRDGERAADRGRLVRGAPLPAARRRERTGAATRASRSRSRPASSAAASATATSRSTISATGSRKAACSTATRCGCAACRGSNASPPSQAQARLDALWRARHPVAPEGKASR